MFSPVVCASTGTWAPGGGVVLGLWTFFRCFRRFYLSFWQAFMLHSSPVKNMKIDFVKKF